MIRRPSTPMIFFIGFSFLFLIPLFFMVYGSLVPSYGSTKFTLSFIVKAFTSNQTSSVILNTLEYGFGAGVLSTAITSPLAWLVARTDVPGRRLFEGLAVMRLAVPLIVEAFSWIFLLSPRIGLINIALERLLGINHPLFNIYSIWGLILAWGIGGIPFAFLVLEPAFRAVDPSLEDASRTCGAGVLRTFFTVTIPIIAPAFFSVFLLISLGGLENFDYPLILGQTGGIQTLATRIYALMDFDQASQAAADGIIYIIITLIILTIYIWITQRSYRFVTVLGNAVSQTRVKLGIWKWPAFFFIALIVFISFVLPIAILTLVSLVPYYSVVGVANPFSTLTLSNYFAAVKIPTFREALVNSFELTIAAGVLTTILGAMMSYVLIKGKERGKKILYFISHLPLAFPGVVYQIALIWTFLVIPLFSSYLYGSLWLMLVALMIVWVPYSIRIISPALTQLSNDLEESAAVSGSGWARRFRTVTLPLLRSAIVNSFTYVMLNSFRELGPIVLLYSSSSIVLIILLDNVYSSDTSFPTIAALSVLMIAMLGVTLLITRLVSRPKFQRLP